MKDWQHNVTRTVHLDHEQLLLLEGGPGARIKVIYRGVYLTPESDARDLEAQIGQEVALWARSRSMIAAIGRACVALAERLRVGTLRRSSATIRRRSVAVEGR